MPNGGNLHSPVYDAESIPLTFRRTPHVNSIEDTYLVAPNHESNCNQFSWISDRWGERKNALRAYKISAIGGLRLDFCAITMIYMHCVLHRLYNFLITFYRLPGMDDFWGFHIPYRRGFLGYVLRSTLVLRAAFCAHQARVPLSNLRRCAFVASQCRWSSL